MLLLAIAIVIAGVFFGAALYVNLVEHPAPINSQLLSSAADGSASQTLELFARWNRRHWIRTVLGGLAFLLLISRSLWR
jgi:hypothetical protein